MTGVSLKQRLVASLELEEATGYLRAATTPAELVSLWWRYADQTEGDVRERLRVVYAEKLRSLGAMHG